MTAAKLANAHRRKELHFAVICHSVHLSGGSKEEVKWDTAEGKSKVMLTALVKWLFCDVVWVSGLYGTSRAAGNSLLSFVSQR